MNKKVMIYDSKVVLSTYSMIITFLVTGVLLGACALTFGNSDTFYGVLVCLLLLMACGMLYAPIRIGLDRRSILIKSLLHTKRISLRNVAEVEKYQPTMGSYRIFASGGYMGYWGIFREGDIGNYAAYYGKASDCFMVTLKNGRKYVLGCQSPDDMINAIKDTLEELNNGIN